MDATAYDQWYETTRGRWIGKCETSLLLESLAPRAGESLLDIGCGTGFFTRSLAAAVDGQVAGIDINPEWVAYARRREVSSATYAVADARALPYANASFDLVVSVTALCFIQEKVAAVREIVRVARRRFGIGFLNRHSLLWLQKGWGGGHGGYRGAHWYTVPEVKALFRDLPVKQLRVCTAIHVPSGGRMARLVERFWPCLLPTGAFILVVGDVARPVD